MSSLNEYVRLLPYGYAPGNYMSKCFACEKVFPDMDKRATRCRPCAEAAFKDHEIERLRAEVAGLRERLKVLEDELDARRKSGSASDRLHNICAALGDKPTTQPSSPSPRS